MAQRMAAISSAPFTDRAFSVASSPGCTVTPAASSARSAWIMGLSQPIPRSVPRRRSTTSPAKARAASSSPSPRSK